MNSIQFIFGIHNHQPVGNFDDVIEDAFEKSYRPFLDVLEDHPSIALSLHVSGCLIEWMEDHHPEYLERIANLVKRGNIEILSAGFYEPILAVIPDRDKLEQIRKMNEYIRSRFDYNPRGIWLTERVWEPHLAKPIREAGIEYITVDDYHFLASGKHADELVGYYNTDEQDHVLGVFPINQKLRYAMPFQEPEVTIDLLRNLASPEGDRVIVMADDGEKFGVWPKSHERCFSRERWLDRMLTALEENRDWIHTTTFNDYFRNHRPLGRVYLPTVSYFEMSEWTLPGDRGEDFSALVHEFDSNGNYETIRPFIRGGTWRNFQSLYDESNWMVKRMQTISNRFAEARVAQQISENVAEEIQNDIWRGQCNCAYWHGIFGGLYLPHLRHAIYQNLIRAEKAMDAILGPDPGGMDIDNDGADEWVMQSDSLKVIVSQSGGAIKELDIRSRDFNLTNTMRRYRESYHQKVRQADANPQTDGSIHDLVILKEPDLDQYLQVDAYPRRMGDDHFFAQSPVANQLRRQTPEDGSFVNRVFEKSDDGNMTLLRTGTARGMPVDLRKTYTLQENVLTLAITVKNAGKQSLESVYASEFNFSLLGGHTPDRFIEIDGNRPVDAWLDAVKDETGIKSLGLVNEWDRFRVILGWESPTDLCRYPVFTVSNSESGFEKVYQSTVILPYWPLKLKPGETFETKITMKVEEW